ncbi:MAG: 4Fe-4S binding protein [Thiohalomonadales bacterium]
MRAQHLASKFSIWPSIKRARARGIDWPLALSRYGFLALLILIPITGLFRIDVSSGFVILDRQIWFSDFAIVFGFWLTVASTLIMLYSTLGTVFCGWVCPQNTLSSWANVVTKKHLGKHAVVDWEKTSTGTLNNAKNNAQNWLLLGIKLLLASMLLALIPLLYFYPPGAIWSFISLQQDDRLAGSLHWIYTVFTFIALANLAVIRHFACRYMCIYRMWQFLFRTRDTLHIAYNETRASECSKCNFCETTCTLDINPRNTNTYDSCINCGECITACNSLHEKKNQTGLLQFKFGPRKNNNKEKTSNLLTWRERLGFVLPINLLGLGIFIWGLISYQPYHLTVYQGDKPRGQIIQNYLINVANKRYLHKKLTLSVSGLPTSAYTLSQDSVEFSTATRKNIQLNIDNRSLDKIGLQTFIVTAEADDGWRDSFRIVHLVE